MRFHPRCELTVKLRQRAESHQHPTSLLIETGGMVGPSSRMSTKMPAVTRT